ncbi:MAG: TlpA disulfide reductase family protein, partial [Pseudomonadota bacterium]
MKKTLPILAALIGLALMPAHTGRLLAQGADLGAAANIFTLSQPYTVPDMTLKNSAGQNVSLSDFRGRVVLLHFWSINCPACKIDEPRLQSLKQTFGPGGLEILGVNLVDPPAMVAGHATQHKMAFPALVDAGAGFSLKVVSMGGKNTAFLVNPAKEAILEVPGFPTTYIIDCSGKAVGYSVGAA